jgi:hypothetical protein
MAKMMMMMVEGTTTVKEACLAVCLEGVRLREGEGAGLKAFEISICALQIYTWASDWKHVFILYVHFRGLNLLKTILLCLINKE